MLIGQYTSSHLLGCLNQLLMHEDKRKLQNVQLECKWEQQFNKTAQISKIFLPCFYHVLRHPKDEHFNDLSVFHNFIEVP